ncbi:MAG: hypothetical protein R3F13_19165 [Prosthecobacter sp.]
MTHLRIVTAFVILSFFVRFSACAHPADQSEMQVRPSPHALEVRFTFNILTLTRFVRIDTDGDMKISMAELEAAQPALVEYLNGNIRLDINQEASALGEDVKFAPLWPNAAKTEPMTEYDYSARNVDVTFTVPVAKLLEDFWIGFEIFEQTGPMQTIRGLFEQDGEVLEVPFSGLEPEYTYDTGYAEDPFIQEAEKKAAEASKTQQRVELPAWLLIPAFLALLPLYRSTIVRRLRAMR